MAGAMGIDPQLRPDLRPCEVSRARPPARARAWAPGLVLILLGGLILGCDRGDAGTHAGTHAIDATPKRAVTVTDAEGFPRAVELPGGEVLSLEGPPLAVVPAYAGGVDLLCLLLPPERLAALPDQALKYSGLRNARSPYLLRPRFDRYLAEPLLALQPDLVIASTVQSADTTAVLRRAGITVVILPDPVAFPDVIAQLELLGSLLGTEERAASQIAQLIQRQAKLEAEGAPRSGLTVLPYTNVGSGGWTAGAGTTADVIIGLAGMTNVAAATGRVGHVRIRFEELLELDPDLILVAGSVDGSTGTVLRNERVLATLSAVKTDGIVALDDWLYTTTSHELLVAAEILAAGADDWLDATR
jgi:iron complex transport system substrate-binding protein